MKDAQKTYKSKENEAIGSKKTDDSLNDRVYIPDNFDDISSDSDQDSFEGNVRHIMGEGQSSKQNQFQTQRWMTEGGSSNQMTGPVSIPKAKRKRSDEVSVEKHKKGINNSITVSPEIFISDDAITQALNSQHNDEEPMTEAVGHEKNDHKMVMQENVVAVDVRQEENIVVEVNKQSTNNEEQQADVTMEEPAGGKVGRIKEGHINQGQARRRSERLMKDITLTTNEKIERMARKKNLQGLMKDSDKEALEQSVDVMLKIALKLLTEPKEKPDDPALPSPPQDDDSQKHQGE